MGFFPPLALLQTPDPVRRITTVARGSRHSLHRPRDMALIYRYFTHFISGRIVAGVRQQMDHTQMGGRRDHVPDHLPYRVRDL